MGICRLSHLSSKWRIAQRVVQIPTSLSPVVLSLHTKIQYRILSAEPFNRLITILLLMKRRQISLGSEYLVYSTMVLVVITGILLSLDFSEVLPLTSGKLARIMYLMRHLFLLLLLYTRRFRVRAFIRKQYSRRGLPWPDFHDGLSVEIEHRNLHSTQ